MHTLKLLLAAFLTVASAATSAQSLALYRNGQQLIGAQEMPNPPDPTPFLYHVKISPGDTFQARVIYTDAAGTQADLTGGQRVMFQSIGCIDATPGGLITIPAANDPRDDCQGQMARLYPSMWVYALDSAGHVLTANAYAFKLTTAFKLTPRINNEALGNPIPPPGIQPPPPPPVD